LPANIFEPEVAKKRTEMISPHVPDVYPAPAAPMEGVTLHSLPQDAVPETITPTAAASLDPIKITSGAVNTTKLSSSAAPSPTPAMVPKPEPPVKPLEILDLGDDLPRDMKDDMPYALMKRLDKCHAEGFVDCVKEHIVALTKCNLRK
jgi:hypothetical protein